ncbi:tyrosine-type recombinase/integrase [Flavivirga spongiicola]|uniref:Site-specific integrase n=1 Tax=Flavivirga spongiicola TaxID=421621 RepID=A0ABU7XMD2_9FLAO|nr:site-specific integrase [Flavivirga sp. MEBiC05379]MDO5981567.1 site-specific integrase [Flavivirga sp. MEBiC05379]
MGYNISIVLDERRIKENGKYPVKLRVYNKFTKKVKRYSLDIDLTTKEFETIWINPENKNLRGSNNEMRLKLQSIETRANNEAKEMTAFDFSKFETKLFRKSSDKNNVQYHFNLVIQKNTKNDKIGTAESYKYTLNSLAKFSQDQNNCPINKLTFDAITIDWLNDYQKFMIAKGKSYTTIAIYTRTLRVIFNNAIEANDISKDIYPFGKNKYKIPRTKKVKKALNSLQLKKLFEAEVLNDNEKQAKDFWFFSYACNGMNLKDIALLKYSDIKNDSFSYYRAKTFDKTAEKTTITIYLTDFTKRIILEYGNNNKNGYVFNIVTQKDDSAIQYKKIKNFTRYINDHIKRIANRNDLPNDLSTYWARHSFATNSLRKGASMEFISEALNHSDLSVTKNYFAGFEDEAKKEFANSLLDF